VIESQFCTNRRDHCPTKSGADHFILLVIYDLEIRPYRPTDRSVKYGPASCAPCPEIQGPATSPSTSCLQSLFLLRASLSPLLAVLYSLLTQPGVLYAPSQHHTHIHSKAFNRTVSASLNLVPPVRCYASQNTFILRTIQFRRPSITRPLHIQEPTLKHCRLLRSLCKDLSVYLEH
jgi:hypothetical protein